MLEPKLRGVPLAPTVMSPVALSFPPASLKSSLPAIEMLSNVATASLPTTSDNGAFVTPASVLPVTVEFAATTNGTPFGCWGIVQFCVNVMLPESVWLGPFMPVSEASG